MYGTSACVFIIYLTRQVARLSITTWEGTQEFNLYLYYFPVLRWRKNHTVYSDISYFTNHFGLDTPDKRKQRKESRNFRRSGPGYT